MVTANELFPLVLRLIYEREDSPQFAQAKQEIDKVLQFFTELLGNSSYFGSEQLMLGDIVAGAAMPLLPRLGINLSNYYPKIHEWCERLMQRPAWRQTELSAEDFEQFKRRVQVLVRLRKRELSRGK